jgi:cell division GTPase FtsZ
VLPFIHEETSEERCIFNTATCIKSAHSVADAVFLADNERFLKKDVNLGNHMETINHEIVAPFFDLLCAGEEVSRKHIGARTVDSGDIMETLDGWTAIGLGSSALRTIRLPLERTRSFRKKGKETMKGLEALDQAMYELSVGCDPRDAGKALYLVSAPAREMNVAMVREMGEIIRNRASDAVLRSGDYPRNRSEITVTVILSQLRDVSRVKELYKQVTKSASMVKKRQKDTEERLMELTKAAEGVPSLL